MIEDVFNDDTPLGILGDCKDEQEERLVLDCRLSNATMFLPQPKSW